MPYSDNKILARLGRTSFRAVKSKRDYVKGKSHYNWLYLSRISAINEYKFLKGIYDYSYNDNKADNNLNNNANTNFKFPVPKPYDHNRHAILMEYIPSYPLCRIEDLGDKEKAYNDLISIVVNLGNKGLIHGDFNEFNILVELNTQKMFMIDFPQMISIAHDDAEVYFNRDIKCINKFFKKKFGMTFDNQIYNFKNIIHRDDCLDIKLKAYGHEKALLSNEIIKNKNIHNEKEYLFYQDEDFEEELEEEIVDKNKEKKKEEGNQDLNLIFDPKEEESHQNGLNNNKIEIHSKDIMENVKKNVKKG